MEETLGKIIVVLKKMGFRDDTLEKILPQIPHLLEEGGTMSILMDTCVVVVISVNPIEKGIWIKAMSSSEFAEFSRKHL